MKKDRSKQLRVAESVRLDNAWGRIWLVVIDPVRAMRTLQAQWNWFPAYVGSAALLSIISLLSYPRVLASLAMLPEDLPISRTQLQWVTQVSLIVMPSVAPVAQAFLTGVALKLLCYLTDIRCRFSKLFSIAMWASFPAHLITTVLNSILMSMLPVERWSETSMGPAVLLPTGTFVWKVARFLDVPNIYFFALVWLGFVVVHKRNFRTTAPMMSAYLLTWMAFSVALVY